MPKLYYEAGVWILPGTQTRSGNRCNIPGTPADLAAWLNARHVEPDPHTTQQIEQKASPSRPADPQTAPTPPPSTLDPAVVEAWIMDEASPAQVEALFTALGVRFHELRSRARST